METAIINEVWDIFAPTQLATASLNFGVGRSRSFCVKSIIWEERPPLKIFASCLVLGVNFWNRIVYHVLCFCGMFTGYHSTRWFLTLRACGAPLTRPGGRATLSCPPGPRLAIAKLWYCIHCLQLFTVSYNVLHCYPRLALHIRL